MHGGALVVKAEKSQRAAAQGATETKPTISEKEFHRLAQEAQEILLKIFPEGVDDLRHGRVTPRDTKKRQSRAEENLEKLRQAVKALKRPLAAKP